jgi:hypothetical protein
MCCLTVGGAAWRPKGFDVGRDRDRFNVFEVLIPGVALYLNRRLASQAIHDLNAVNVALKS